MADKVCIKKGCNWTRTHGYFCVEHRVLNPLIDPRERCAAKFCYAARPLGSMFCDEHKLAMNRDCGAPTFNGFDVPVEQFRAPLPDRRPVAESSQRDFKPSPEKLVIKWDSDHRRYEATCGSTNVTGHGLSPGQAIRNWHYWWDCPF